MDIVIPIEDSLTHKHLEIQECVLSDMATDALVLKHQGISSHNPD